MYSLDEALKELGTATDALSRAEHRLLLADLRSTDKAAEKVEIMRHTLEALTVGLRQIKSS